MATRLTLATLESRLGILHLWCLGAEPLWITLEGMNVPRQAPRPGFLHLLGPVDLRPGICPPKLDAWLHDYLERGLWTPWPALHWIGSSFDIQVWEELLLIPCGETISYLELARRLSRPQAVRAVASAVGRNPIPLLAPCHRVIRSDGALGGYDLGLHLKGQLLQLERDFAFRAATA